MKLGVHLVNFAYPGGPAIQQVATLGAGDVTLPRARLPGTYNFSFSGLKTAVLHRVRDTVGEDGNAAPANFRGARLDIAAGLSDEQVAHIASAFQQSVVDVLVTKTVKAAEEFDVASVAVVGGVAANAELRSRMQAAVSRPLFITPPEFATDNAAMIGSAAYYVPDTWNEADIEPGLEL